ncbi:hypothetical protein ATR1_176c0001, partial [Acetobacter tropicalis]
SCGMTEFYKMTRNCLKCEKSALSRKKPKPAAVALANRMARIA